MNVPLSFPDITELEVDYVTRVLWSGQLSLGPRVAEFEEQFAAYAGARYAIAVNSGTSALHLDVGTRSLPHHSASSLLPLALFTNTDYPFLSTLIRILSTSTLARFIGLSTTAA
jgi:hypothetical protein